MKITRNVVGLAQGIIRPEFVYSKNGVTTFECREIISRMANGAEEICIFKCVFGPREAHSKHRHTKCDEIVFCISGRGVEGIETSPGVFEEFEYVPGTIMHMPTGVGHYTRNPDYFENLHLLGIFVGVPDMLKETTGYKTIGDIRPEEMKIA
jgi:quercetin dioxygenase-like cupin family protein